MKIIQHITLAIATACFAIPGMAQHTMQHDAAANAHAHQGHMEAVEMTQGLVKKIDKATQKITLKHGEIKNIDMPPMTMVFKAKNPAMLDQVKVGDKVDFTADMQGETLLLTDIKKRP